MADKKRSRGLWNMLFSAADPELKDLADRIRGTIPENSILRSKFVERIIGVVKGWAESKAEDLSPVAGAVVEKLTDLGDFFVGSDGPKTTKAAQDWMDRFFAEAGKRLEKTRAEDLQAEAAKILSEFKLRREILEAIESVRRESLPPVKPVAPIDWSKLDEKFSSILKKTGERLSEFDGKANEAVLKFRRRQKWLRRRPSRQETLEGRTPYRPFGRDLD